jgi:hypothetical protein
MIAILNSCTRLLVKSIKLHYGVRKFKLTTLQDRIFYYDVSIIPRLLLNFSTEESLVVGSVLDFPIPKDIAGSIQLKKSLDAIQCTLTSRYFHTEILFLFSNLFNISGNILIIHVSVHGNANNSYCNLKVV